MSKCTKINTQMKDGKPWRLSYNRVESLHLQQFAKLFEYGHIQPCIKQFTYHVYPIVPVVYHHISAPSKLPNLGFKPGLISSLTQLFKLVIVKSF